MDKIKFILSTVQPMAEYTFPYLTSIVGVKDSQSGQHIGSGLRCMLGGKRAVITALHVIETALGYSGGIAISTGYGKPPYIVRGEIRVDHAGDLALYHLPDDFPSADSEVGFWPEDRFQLSDNRISTDYLFVHGFPESRSRFIRMFDGLASKTLPYGVMQRLESLPADLQSFQFALDFDPANMHTPHADDKSGVFVDPHGLSGSPVWRIGLSGGTAADWKPELSYLIGFVTQWRPDEKVLVATRTSQLSATGMMGKK